jgi:GDA1/CD39 (nucleoside phosphatase) family
MYPNKTLEPISSASDLSIIEADIYQALMVNDNHKGDYETCRSNVQDLLRKDANAWCDFAHDRDCSFAGIYQPPLPIESKCFGEFIATSNFYDVWDFLNLPSRASLRQVQERTVDICEMNYDTLMVYNQKRAKPLSDPNDIIQFCFRAAFVSEFLVHGLGFPLDYNITAIDVIDGQKLGWALGSILYEINTLPWRFDHKRLTKSSLNRILGMFVEVDEDSLLDMQSWLGEMCMTVVAMSVALGILYWAAWKPAVGVYRWSNLSKHNSRAAAQDQRLSLSSSTVEDSSSGDTALPTTYGAIAE